MPSANDLRKGMGIKYNNDVCVVLDMQHRTPGNLRAFVQATLRSLKSGKSSNVRFASTESIEVVSMTTRRLDFSYKDHNGYHFMDPENYETTTLNEEFVGEASKYLTENLQCTLMEVEGKAVELELPPKVKLKVVEAPPGVRGDTATNVTKPAKVETGFEVGVPLFIDAGDSIEVDTRTGKYLNRAETTRRALSEVRGNVMTDAQRRTLHASRPHSLGIGRGIGTIGGCSSVRDVANRLA